ncbi:helix-turn-helix domain-containing protein [Escherichia coli]|uniref:helix-turn-helix domain-containing protein n=1 Tax=Escherichia coli TaxID=562 RepID=UPI0020CC2C12|nr:helix-turn-helix domain-containing protein [Escherichia coli]
MRPVHFSRYPDLPQSCQSNKWRFQVEEEIFTREEAASYLKVDKGTITQWIRSGRLQAAKINPDKPKSPYRICKSDCIAALKSVRHNSAVNAVDVQEDKACQSNNVPVRGTATSLRLVEVELDGLLGQRTKGKRRSSMIS